MIVKQVTAHHLWAKLLFIGTLLFTDSGKEQKSSKSKDGKKHSEVHGKEWKNYIQLETGGNRSKCSWFVFYSTANISEFLCFVFPDVIFSEVDTDDELYSSDGQLKTYGKNLGYFNFISLWVLIIPQILPLYFSIIYANCRKDEKKKLAKKKNKASFPPKSAAEAE